jgi:hypothetical protein
MSRKAAMATMREKKKIIFFVAELRLIINGRRIYDKVYFRKIHGETIRLILHRMLAARNPF